jgi:hypothetical protein
MLVVRAHSWVTGNNSLNKALYREDAIHGDRCKYTSSQVTPHFPRMTWSSVISSLIKHIFMNMLMYEYDILMFPHSVYSALLLHTLYSVQLMYYCLRIVHCLRNAATGHKPNCSLYTVLDRTVDNRVRRQSWTPREKFFLPRKERLRMLKVHM